MPEGLAFGKPLYWSWVYEDFVLLATWQALEGRERLAVPGDLEALLEAVYEATPEGFPESLRKRAEESYSSLQKRFREEADTARKLSLSEPGKLLAFWDETAMVADFRIDDDEEKPEIQRLLTRLGTLAWLWCPSSGCVKVFTWTRRGSILCG